MNITIHFTVSKNSILYLRQALASYVNLSFDSRELQFCVYCLDQRSFREVSQYKDLCRVVFLGEQAGSFGHALALNTALRNFAHNGINILSDTDVMIVRKNWDHIIGDLLAREGIDLVGTQHEKIGGFISQNIPAQQYKNKPSTTWIAFREGCNVEDLDLSPDKLDIMPIVNQDESELFGIPVGYQLFKDTGWRIPYFIEQESLSYKVFDLVKPSNGNSQVLKGSFDYHDEFHLDGIAFLVHQRGSMRHLFRYDTLSRDFYQKVDDYLGFPSWSIHLNRHVKLIFFLIQAKRFFRKGFSFAKKSWQSLRALGSTS